MKNDSYTDFFAAETHAFFCFSHFFCYIMQYVSVSCGGRTVVTTGGTQPSTYSIIWVGAIRTDIKQGRHAITACRLKPNEK